MILIKTGFSPGQHLNAHHLRLFDGERAGFVEEYLSDAAEVFEHILCLDKHTGGGKSTSTGDVRHRRSDKQRAGRGQYQHLGESRRHAGDSPRNAGDRQRQHGERHSQAISGFHHGRTGLLCGSDEFEDALVLGIGGHLGGAHSQCSGAIHRTGHHSGACEHLARHRLAVDVAQVERGRAGKQFAINRHGFAWQHHKHIAQLHLLDRHSVEAVRGGLSRPAPLSLAPRASSPRRRYLVPLSEGSCRRSRLRGGRRRNRAYTPEAIGRIVLISGSPTPHARQVDDVRSLRCCLHQCGQTVLGLGLRVFLNGLAGRNHQHDRPACPVLADGNGGKNRHYGQQIDADLSVAQIVNHATHCVNHNDCHQRDYQPLTYTRITQHRHRNCVAPWAPIAQQCQRDCGDNNNGKHRHKSADVEDFGEESDESAHHCSLRSYTESIAASVARAIGAAVTPC